MHFALRTHTNPEFRVTGNYWSLWKGPYRLISKQYTTCSYFSFTFCKYAPDYLYSIYICDLSPLRFAVVERVSVRFPFISRLNGLGSFRTAQAIRSKKLSSVRTARAHPSNRSNGLSARLLFQNNSPKQFATNLSQNVDNSYKRCLPSPHELSRYIFYSIHLFCHNSRLSLQGLFKTEL